MHPFCFSVSLRTFSKSPDPTVAPTEIAAKLEMNPEYIHKMGERRTTPDGMFLEGIYDENYCTFSLDRKGEEELNEMLARIIIELLPHKNLFHRIRSEGGRAEFFIGWFSTGNTGDTLGHDMLKKMGDLGIDLALDVYGESHIPSD
ncbi:MAG: DUF4279 domain-containing protein [Zoogloeaceae bacterium]|jgi:hypothetical protein|nr:DUF4279 domain-containing protein [Zoogloeaceae bacterium]